MTDYVITFHITIFIFNWLNLWMYRVGFQKYPHYWYGLTIIYLEGIRTYACSRTCTYGWHF